MKNRRISILLLGLGIMILTFVGFVAMKHPFGTTEAESIVTEVMDDAASVFIWEAVTIAFLETSTIASQQMVAANRFASLSLSSSSPKEKSIKIDSHNIFTETGGDVADTIISKTEEGLEELVDKARKERAGSLFHREKKKKKIAKIPRRNKEAILVKKAKTIRVKAPTTDLKSAVGAF